MRRKPDQIRVRHGFRDISPEHLLDEYGEKIVYLRSEMQRALDALIRDDSASARRTLKRALDERWWK